MVSKRQVRIVKRIERERMVEEAAGGAGPSQSPREAARDLMATVTEWVNEFQQERRRKPPALWPRES
jgi:hypothetical protein